MDSHINNVPSPLSMLNLDLKTDKRVWPFTFLKDPINREFLGNVKCLHFAVPNAVLSLSFSIYSEPQVVPRRLVLLCFAYCCVPWTSAWHLDMKQSLASIAQVLMVTRIFRRPETRDLMPCLKETLCQSVVAVSECGPGMARSSGSFGKPRNLTDWLAGFQNTVQTKQSVCDLWFNCLII